MFSQLLRSVFNPSLFVGAPIQRVSLTILNKSAPEAQSQEELKLQNELAQSHWEAMQEIESLRMRQYRHFGHCEYL